MGFLDRMGSSLGLGEALPEEDHVALNEAVALADAGHLSAAEERLRDLARRHRDQPAVQVALGTVCARLDDHEAAVEAFGRAVDRDKGQVEAWLGLADALTSLRRGDPARDAYRKALSLTGDPRRRARAHAGRGRLALKEQRLAKAIRELRRAAELDPGDLAIAADLGRALLRDGDAEGWPWLNRAASDPQASIDLVQEAATTAPDLASAEALLTQAIARLEGDAATAAVLRAALAVRLARADRLDEALSMIEEAQQAAPDSADVLVASAQVFERRGDFAAALGALNAAADRQAVVDTRMWLRLALSNQDRAALETLAARADQLGDAGPALRAFVAGEPSEEDLLTLAACAPTEAARRHLASALAPGAVPHGNLFALLAYARDLARRTPELQPLFPSAARAAEALDRPLLIAVMGEFNAGKSSFVNALVGQEVAPVGVTPTTATINVLRHGPPGARVLYQDGSARELAAGEVNTFLAALDAEAAAAIRTVEIFFPLEFLQRVEIVDTPGLNSLRPEHEAVARGFLIEADAIVWLFSVAQAAKATEREALGMAHAAGKRVLGILNKADQADASELASVCSHVAASLGDRIETLLPLSAREALRARRRGDEAALQASGLPALMQALDDRFFHEARELKRRSAKLALERFVVEARSRVGEVSPTHDDASERELEALAAQEQAFAGALAAERVGLIAGLERLYREAVGEVLEFIKPRAWPFGERRAETADEEFLLDLLDDGIEQAIERSEQALAEAAGPERRAVVRARLEWFRAYALGRLVGAVERFLHQDLPGAGARRERVVLERALLRHLPDAERELFTELARQVAASFEQARAAIRAAALRRQLAQLIREQRLQAPVTELGRAVEALG